MSANLSNVAVPAAQFQPQTVADQIVLQLMQLGVEYTFGVPGGGIEPLFESLERLKTAGGPVSLLARHESGAASMADGYARETGRLGVVLATTGPGATNLATGLGTAWTDRVPVLALTAQTPLPFYGTGAIQESSDTAVDTVAMLKPVTRFSSFVSHPQQLRHKLPLAIRHAFGPLPGPVHLSIPVDLARTAPLGDFPLLPASALAAPSAEASSSQLVALRKLLLAARQPLLIIGRECHRDMAGVMRFARRYRIPYVAAPSAVGLIDRQDPQFLGVVELAGHRPAIQRLRSPETDLLIVAGADLAECTNGRVSGEDLRSRQIVHISPTQALLMQSPMAQLQILAEPGQVLGQLSKAVGVVDSGNSGSEPSSPALTPALTRAPTPAPQQADQARPVSPRRLFAELPEFCPAGTRFFADSGNSMLWAIHALAPKMPAGYPACELGSNGVVAVSPEFGAMGWAQAAALGAACARPGQPVVCLVGDGSFLMAGQEISVAAQQDLPVVFVVLNDSTLGTVKHGQRLAGSVPCAFDLPAVDFRMLAEAQGVAGFIVESIDELRSLPWDDIFALGHPVLIDVRIDPEEAPPLGFRVDSLHQEAVTLGQGALERLS